MRFSRLAVALLFVVAACQSPTGPALIENPIEAGEYDYPLDNPFAATVVGTPAEFRAALPKNYDVEEFRLDLFPDREVPEVLWYLDGLAFSLARQPGPAPLIFSIAGTGSDSRSRLMRILESVLVGYGFHVISVASPTHPNFVVSGSETSVPGRVGVDVQDLYRAMEAAYAHVKDEIEVTDIYLTGYSLGAWHAAFLAHMDEEEKAFEFGKVLLINPPVSLFDSIGILDRMLEESIPGGLAGINDFFDQAFAAFTEIYKETEFVDFTDDFLYRAYRRFSPTDDDLAALVGLAFRLAANNMAFTADVMNGGGYIVPRGAELGITTTLTPFFRSGIRVGFLRYLEDLFAPYYIARDDGTDFESLVAEANLKRIDGYLRRTRRIGLLANADDIILGPGDIEYLGELFEGRALILPNGGHLGNLEHRYVVAAIGEFFAE